MAQILRRALGDMRDIRSGCRMGDNRSGCRKGGSGVKQAGLREIIEMRVPRVRLEPVVTE